MAPKGRQVALGRAPAQKSYAQTVYQTITSPDNRSLMISLSFFAHSYTAAGARFCYLRSEEPDRDMKTPLRLFATCDHSADYVRECKIWDKL